MSDDRGALIDQCLKCIASQKDRQVPRVTLMATAGRLPRGFPRGEVMCQNDAQAKQGIRVMSFPALRVLAYLFSSEVLKH